MTGLFYPELLTDGVVRLRPWADGDVSCVERAAQDSRIPEGTSVPARYTPEAGLAFIRRQHDRLASGRGVSLAIAPQTTDEAVGLVILQRRPQDAVAGIGYWVVPDARHQGLAGRAVRLATDWGLGPAGFARVEAWVQPENVASQRTLRAGGYLREGLLRSFLAVGTRRSDVFVYSRIRDEDG